ncbi:hypothetical protein G6F57_004262 [Rhizopus arrhizus]|uniref:CUE domain-containing protein n=1 Tax=Rhizopus oryzae TaxID=64495 RepID=A0A9P6XJH0_RHIOR|nr:hypothetical protein G6F23_002565 [Rhizopus arrhizus]KAG1426971.1 hypothetical protein G6F58_001230 [Rhizopus delemar]KAG0767856.1 hypothetical protein G6F24_002433 [Rhizopus arrhizus]KAG0792797.1 hypothetical protein G6F21_004094 [Rhizopus arrhizus]KAG0800822.1 hypothetical protein G6F22_001849 [Rhizopus arrhizus]
MEIYKESDTVSDLFQEIENLIDNKSVKDEYNSFERPILIESDSDEEMPAPVHHTMATCYKCNRPVATSDQILLQVNLCSNCNQPTKKKRERSRSFTFDIGQFADKLKQSLQLPQTSVGRRKSMPSMNEAYLEPPPLTSSRPSSSTSRPSSRASSFIEDVKQFLSPLSRRSSRNSLFHDFQNDGEVLQKKTSHSSLFDAINICKPKRTSFSYEKRVIQQPYEQDELSKSHITVLRRKQIKQIESRQERMGVYENAYVQCMETQTGLMSWVTKQAQKGPPDAWFGYTPPPKEPKKFLGIFKRKTKSNDLRAQQLQLNDELLSKLPSLNPSSFTNEQEDDEEYGQDSYLTEQTSSPSDISTPQQTVSILKKTNSNRDIYEDAYYYNEQEDQEEQQEEDYYQEESFEKEYVTQGESKYSKKKSSLGYHHRQAPRDDYFDYVDQPPLQQRRSFRRARYPASNDTYYPEHYRARRPSYNKDLEGTYYPFYNSRIPSTSSSNSDHRRNSNSSNSSYYMPKMMKSKYISATVEEEWELALDDLCDLFPRLDRHYLDEFLVSAQGDFDAAKDMIMNMIMGIR